MANQNNTVAYRDGNAPDDLLTCCGERPRQGWSFMGSFIWCNKCGNKITSQILDQWELADGWNERQEARAEDSVVICSHCCGTGKSKFSRRPVTETKARCSYCNGTGESGKGENVDG